MKIKIAYIFLVFTVFFSSCDKWVDIQTTNGLALDEYWKRKQDVTAVLSSCYLKCRNAALVQRMFAYSEVRSDLYVVTGKEEKKILSGDITPQNPLFQWFAFYDVINSCNMVLTYSKNVLEHDPEFTEADLKEAEAEAKFLRSLMYFYLTRAFKDVPLVFNPSMSDGQDYKVPLSTQNQILAQIETDLLFSVENLPFLRKNEFKPYNTARATKFAAYALLADVYLWTNQFQKAKDACSAIIKSDQYKLTTQSFEWYSMFDRKGSNMKSEIIFEIDFAQTNNWIVQNCRSGAISFYSTRFDSLFNDEDYRKKLGWYYTGTGNKVIQKFSYIPNTYTARVELNASMPVYRIAEVFLMRSEAFYRLGMVDSASADMKFLKIARNCTMEDTIAVDDAVILNERARELAGECKRWFDILRICKYNNYSNLSLLEDLLTLNTPIESISKVSATLADSNSMYFPINDVELRRNTLLIQNKYYNNF